mgnify:CR=1 FL=1
MTNPSTNSGFRQIRSIETAINITISIISQTMSKVVYRTKKVECERCEEQMLIDTTSIDNGPRNDPKVRHTESGEEWQDNVHCECGNCLSPKSSRYGPRGYTVIDHFVDEVKASELEDKEPDFGSLF